MHGMTTPSRLRKRPLEDGAATSARAADELDIAGCATIAYSSEHPAHPVEHMLDGRSGLGATRWISARPDTVERIVVEFDQPQPISRFLYEVEEAMLVDKIRQMKPTGSTVGRRFRPFVQDPSV
jgi:hypothetical protein